MEVHKISIFKVLDKSDAIYSIPVYQRNYVWQKQECEKLIQDITNIQGDFYFIGPTIWVRTDTLNERFNIVDGQQRLTTIILILTAVKNYLIQNNQNDIRIKQINRLISNEDEQDEALKLKLKPNNQDKKYYDIVKNATGIIDNNESASNIINNYNYFYNECSRDERLLNIIEYIKRIQFALIILENNENPYLIFESINSKGKHLNSADLIRNFILMDLSQEEQATYYNEYWMKIEDLIGDAKIEDYVWNFLRFKLRQNIKIENVYKEFKQYAKNDKIVTLKELYKYVINYAIFCNLSNQKYTNSKIQYRIEQFHKLNKDVVIPYLFALFDNNTSDDEKIKSMIIIESYILRNLFIKRTTQGFNNQFCVLEKQIQEKVAKKEKTYYDALCSIICPKMATDIEFVEAIEKNDAYHTKVAKYMLTSMENNSDYKMIFNQEHQIEHIFPQKPDIKNKPNYTEEDWDFMKKMTHNLANLSIIKDDKNQKASNKSEEEKLNIDIEYKKLWLNEDRNGVFSKTEFKNREAKLIKRALEIWPCPSGFVKENNNDVIIISSEEEFDLEIDSYLKPVKINIEYLGKTDITEIFSWRDILIFITEWFYKESPQEIKNFWDQRLNFMTNEQKERYCITLGNGITIKTCASSKEILRYIYCMIKQIGIIDNIIIEVK